MNVQELRIGNLIHNDRLNHTETVQELYAYGNINTGTDAKYSGILLTEEWLLKLGFTPETIDKGNQKVQGYWKNILMMTPHHKDKWTACPYGYPLGIWRSFYVHQLQNLYFALTGEELTPKEK